MSNFKTYYVIMKADNIDKKIRAIVSAGNRESALKKFIIHASIHTYDFMYDENDHTYYSLDNSIRIKMKRINIHNDFIVL